MRVEPSLTDVEPSTVPVEPSTIDIGHHRRVDEWRLELAELVTRGRSSYGEAEVRAALEQALEDVAQVPEGAQPLAPVVAVLGLTSCSAGWVGVLVRPTGQTTLHVGSKLVGLVEQVRDQEVLAAVGVHAISRREEVGAWLASRPTVEVLEVLEPDAESQSLVDAGLTLPAMYSGMGFTQEELQIAGAAAIASARLFT